MPSEKSKNETPDQLESLFGKPPLLEGEDQERYLRLRAAIVADLKPKSILDWINVHDQVNKLWEEQRYKRAAAAIINGAMLKALQYYLEDIQEPFGPGDPALDYFSSNANEKKKVISLLAQHGITMAELQAKAMQLESPGLQMFERMVAARENGRRLLRKEHRTRGDSPGGNNEE